MSAPLVTSVQFVQSGPFPGVTTALATMDDGSSLALFTFYADELRFSDAELVGLTHADALALRHARDVAYLQS